MGFASSTCGNTVRGLVVLLAIITGCSAAPRTIATAHAQGPASLVQAGQPRAVIVLPAEPQPLEQKAADELVEHIRLISGATLPVVSADQATDAAVAIRLGQAADAALDDQIKAKGVNPSAFALSVSSNQIQIRGLSDEGTLFGAYELLERLGVRWYHPGDLGRVIPKTDTVQLEDQLTIQVPSMDFRMLQHITAGDWPQRVRMGGEHRSTGSHGIPPFRGGAEGRKWFESNPEYYSLVNGERTQRQVCVGNPEALQVTIAAVRKQLEANPGLKYIGMGPNDGSGYCQCELCTALDQDVYDPLYAGISMTDRYIWYFNQILDALEEDYPDLHIVWYVYAAHFMPPAIQPNPRIVGVFAPITLDRIRGMDNPMSPDRHVLRWIIDEWAKLGLNEFYYRGYYNNLACPQFPISQVDRIRHETPAFREKGINVMRVEVIRNSWSASTPSIYLAARMMWDVNTDVDALLAEFYDKFYGPAREPMGQYHEALDAAFRDTPYFAGSSWPYIAIFDNDRRSQFRSILDQAGQLAATGDAVYAQRVEAVRMAWDRLELFLDMIHARNAHDWTTAYEKMNAFYQISDAMVAQVLEGHDARERSQHRQLHWGERSDNRSSYFNRFWSGPTKAGYQRAVEIGQLVAPLPDQWQFLIDPVNIGEIAGYDRPGPIGGNWQPLLTSRTWSDQGLHYYKGAAWYRTEVTIPQDFEGKPIYLWFGGVDRLATVWVNGQLLGTSAEPLEGLPGVPGSFRPFDMNATKAIKFGQPNTVVVKILNDRLSELGTGGIVAPVMFWTPNDPNWSPAQ